MKKHGKKTAGILLAAGASTRMGQAKQLLPAGKGTLLEISLNHALDSNLDKIILVLGFQADAIKQALGGTLECPGLEIVLNENYLKGMSTSLKAGISVLNEGYDNAMILLADMPYIKSEHINFLLDRYMDSGMDIGALKIKGKRSHPVIFEKRMFGEFKTLTGDTGARLLFSKYSGRTVLFEPPYEIDNMDIDTPEDFLNFRQTT